MALVEIDPLTGAQETYSYDHNTGAMHFSKSLNIDSILDLNQWAQNQGKSRDATWRGEDNSMWHVATVPLITLQDWLHEFNSVRAVGSKVRSIYTDDPDWDKFVMMRINSSDYQKLKTAPVSIL